MYCVPCSNAFYLVWKVGRTYCFESLAKGASLNLLMVIDLAETQTVADSLAAGSLEEWHPFFVMSCLKKSRFDDLIRVPTMTFGKYLKV